MPAYTGTFAGYTIAVINYDFSFLLESYHFVSPINTLAKAASLTVRFLFYKGCTVNIQELNFCRFPADISSLCPLRAALHALDRWRSFNIDPLTPILLYRNMKVITFIHNSVVTKKST